jgi:rod shape-determining protein MreB
MLNLRSFISDRLAIDLGTANTRVYVQDEGIVIDEPSVVAVDLAVHPAGRVVAVGFEASSMLGKTPEHIRVIRPVRYGAITEIDAACAMLSRFIHRARSRSRFSRFQAVIAVPAGISQIESHAVVEAAEAAGASRIQLLEGTLAAALGADLPIAEPVCSMVVDIGGGTTEVAVMSLSGIVASRTTRVAGDQMNMAIKNYIRRRFDLLIGESWAERAKTAVGSACPQSGDHAAIEIRGRDVTSGIPKVIRVDTHDIWEAISDQIHAIVQTARTVLEEIPPELSADVIDRGFLLTGGGALLKNLGLYLSTQIGIPAVIPADPLSTVLLGAAGSLDCMHDFSTHVIAGCSRAARNIRPALV